MNRQEDRQERIHARIWDLIPWYVNGSLPVGERQTVEDHLALCPRCREEERFCRVTAEALQRAGEMAPSPHPVQLARLMARIDEADKEPRSGRLRRLLAGLRSWQPANPARAMLVAQLAIVLLLAGLVVWQGRQPAAPAVYKTLSDSEAPQTGAAPIRVLFSEDATERQIRELLLGVHGEIVGGPSAIGAYTLEIRPGGDPQGVVLAYLRSHPKVRFAEPVVGGSP
jgi:anti-sigma factor RsiW